MTWQILEGDAVTRLADLEPASVQTCVTSPPYWGLRDYGEGGQLGLEPTPEEYVANLVAVFREVRRVLRDDGTVWLNLGDSYAAQGGSKEANIYEGKRVGAADWQPARSAPLGLKPKDLVGIPWRVAFALQADGWWLRSDIIWNKPNPMPESVTDRPTRSHEYIFLLTKSARYFYDADAVREAAEHRDWDGERVTPIEAYPGHPQAYSNGRSGYNTNPSGRNKRSVWTVTTQPYAEAHFATFPPKLIEPCILAGAPPKCCGECGAPWERVVESSGQPPEPEHRNPPKRLEPGEAGNVGAGNMGFRASRLSGQEMAAWKAENPDRTVGWQSTCDHDDDSGRSTVLDPFAGSGTTGLVALRHDRSFVGIELNPEYCEMARNRIRDDAPLLNTGIEV